VFVARDLFRRTVHTPGDEARASRFASVDGLWADLLGRGTRTPAFRLVRDGETLPSSTYTRRAGIGHRSVDDVVQPNRVLELYADGATVVLQALQLTDPHLARVANNLALDLDQAVQVNAYLTPVAARGLELHFDYHDVFVLQLEGAKHWRVWEPLARTRAPVREARVAMPTWDELGAPVLDLTLTAGDCLYLPRGFPHAAAALDSSSAHLTIGVLATTWQQVVRHALDEAVAAGGWRDAARAGDTVPSLAPLAEQLDPVALERWRLRSIWRRQPATRLRPRTPVEPADTTPLRVTPGPLVWLQCDDATVQLGLGDRTLTMPAEAHPLLAAVLRAEGDVTLAELRAASGLDTESVWTVGRRLVAEGLLAPADG
jgi:lysine-specific demethylase/histidyl-hydroxylase NO66